ncbi:MAG TPA: ChbG/HpnK family deacetylase [Chitinophagaceae bacterium]|nr:ChbG/HpnK family deacetylase [Chitinophagaceae bacterium]
MSRLIVNADDFGFSTSINKAVIDSLETGIVNSASLMTNTPGFREAAELAKEKGFADRIGVHINLTEGKPVSNFNHARYLTEDGSWNKTAVMDLRRWNNKKIRDDFSEEIIAQIGAMEKSGMRPSHINSHHHVHTFPALFQIFLSICRSRGYKLRIAQTYGSGSYLKSAYRKYLNAVMKRSGINFSDYFETSESYCQRKQNFKKGLVEIMVHPAPGPGGAILDITNSENPELLKIHTSTA